METKEVIPGGRITLLDSMGSDLDIVNSARISFNKRHDQMEEGDDKLIHFLLKNRHGTPFEIPIFRFQVRAPLTVFREWQRHRISSFNEVSGRYVKMELDAYLPEPGVAIREQKGKPGAYHYETMEVRKAKELASAMQQCYHNASDCYEELLEQGMAKEVARGVLPQNLFSEMIYQANARSIMNFISLRSAENAMYEIRQFSYAIEEMFREVLPITYEAFVKYGRQAP
jgi:thymidylate synthase (FAD)